MKVLSTELAEGQTVMFGKIQGKVLSTPKPSTLMDGMVDVLVLQPEQVINRNGSNMRIPNGIRYYLYGENELVETI